MRAALWFLALFGIAVAAAMFVGNNQGTVTLFWPPYRVDLALNLFVFLLLLAFLLVYAALRTLSALFALPEQAQRWRMQYRERHLYTHLLDAQLHQYAGRFTRARKAALVALQHELALQKSGDELPEAARVRALGHLLAAEASHVLQDKVARDQHLQAALEHPDTTQASEASEALLLRAAGWALDDQEITKAHWHLESLPQGAARRTLALRMRLRVARLSGQPEPALEIARLLAKHRAFSPGAARSLVRELAQDVISAAHDPDQIIHAWSQLEPAEQRMPEVALHAALRLQNVGGDISRSLLWVLPAWEQYVDDPDQISEPVRLKLIQHLQTALQSATGVDAAQWLARVETAQSQHPSDPNLQYLAGRVFVAQQLWGKGQKLLEQAAPRLAEPGLKRQAWRTLEHLAHQRGDSVAAQNAQRQAALV